jgi:hypothetical protein
MKASDQVLCCSVALCSCMRNHILHQLLACSCLAFRHVVTCHHCAVLSTVGDQPAGFGARGGETAACCCHCKDSGARGVCQPSAGVFPTARVFVLLLLLLLLLLYRRRNAQPLVRAFGAVKHDKASATSHAGLVSAISMHSGTNCKRRRAAVN